MPVIVTSSVTLGDEELEWKFIRASGPGGQNVNKVSSAVQLRFNLAANSSIPAAARNRLRRLAGRKLLDDGSILLSARSERSQDQNRRAAIERLAELIRSALPEPKVRRITKPTKGSKERRIESKKHRGATKKGRRSVSESW